MTRAHAKIRHKVGAPDPEVSTDSPLIVYGIKIPRATTSKIDDLNTTMFPLTTQYAKIVCPRWPDV